MNEQKKSPLVAIVAIIGFGLVGLAATMFFLMRDDTPDPEPATPKEEVQVDVDTLKPIPVSTSDKDVRWMFIDPERGLRTARNPIDIPKNVRASVVVWKSDFPPHDVYYIVDLSDADINESEVAAIPLSPEDFEARSREVVTALWLAQDVTYLAEDLAIETIARDVRGKRKSRKATRQRKRTVIDRMNKYPTFRVPGR